MLFQILADNPTVSVLGLTTLFFSILWIVSVSQIRALRKNKDAEIDARKRDIQNLEGLLADQKRANETLDAELNELKAKFSPTFDQEAVVSRLKSEEAELISEIESIRHSYADKRALLDQLKAQVAVYDERLAFAELGAYEPHFEFTDSEAFKKRNV